MKKKSIGFFGGSFDPIHCGHLHLALSFLEKYKLDQILFCPAGVSPFKMHKKPHVSSLHREEMVKRAIHSIPFFSYCDLEIHSEGPSFTIDTIRRLRQTFLDEKQDISLYLLLGDDVLRDLPLWKDIEELLSITQPLLGSRHPIPELPSTLSPKALAALQQGYSQIPILDISSTMLRDRIQKGEYCGHLVPFHVLEYIHLNKLYE